MKLCYVTDRKALPGSPEEQMRLLLEKIERAAHAGVDWIQIREKDLEGRKLLWVVEEAKRRAGSGCKILVNDRLDVALAGGADGVHLGEQSLPAAEARRFAQQREGSGKFLVGTSRHSLDAAKEAEAAGADYVIFGPVFPTPSKMAYGLPHGIGQLGAACRAVAIPVLAIGGITIETAHECVAARVAGIAAIRLFQEADDVAEVVKALRA
jgi:thiamine-phosphate pyrophosphorylase